MKYWEIIADNLSKAGWSWAALQPWIVAGGQIFAADAHRDDGKRFIVSADEELTAFLELERITHDDIDRNQTVPFGLESFRSARR